VEAQTRGTPAAAESTDASDRHQAINYATMRVLAEAETLAAATPRLLQALCETMGWDFGAIWRVDEAAGLLRCIDVWHPEGRPAGEFEEETSRRTFDPGIGLPGRVWESGQAAWVRDVVVDDNFPRAPLAAREGLHGALAFPIHLGPRVLGVLEVFSREVQPPDRDLLLMMGAIGGQIGQFIRRREAEEAIRESETRHRAILESALDCIVSIDAGGRIIEFNPAAQETFGYPRDQVLGQLMVEVLVPPHLRDDHVRGFSRYLETGIPSLMGRRIEMEGLRSDGTVFPIELTVTRVPLSGPPVFTAYLRDISVQRRAEREREALFRREQQARTDAEDAYTTLQRSLLPPQLPEIPGLELAARYRAAGPGNLVGGDFYDIFQTAPGEWGLIIGDVCGRGAAAAALTALTRYTARAAAMQERNPSAVLRLLNDALLREVSPGTFCTAVFARLRTGSEGCTLQLSVGGHPPPMILRGDGAVQTDVDTGTLLGALPDPPLSDDQIELGPGDTLFMYTDGVVEQRTADGLLGIDRLAEMLQECRGLDLATALARLDRSLDRARVGPRRDDSAMLAARVTPRD
jgi:PAS domain S-box-containing protein